jgi:hypothetical protein
LLDEEWRAEVPMRDEPTSSNGGSLVHDIASAWRVHGPDSPEFQSLMDEAVSLPDAGDILCRSCVSQGEEGARLADDMRRHVAEGQVVFTTDDGHHQVCATAVLTIPVIGKASDIDRLASAAVTADALRSAMVRHGMFPPGTQVAMLRRALFPADLAQISPEMLHAIRSTLGVIAFEGEDSEEDGTTWREVAEGVGLTAAGCQPEPPRAGWTVGYLVCVRATPVSEDDPPGPDEAEIEALLDVAFADWQEEAQGLLDATLLDCRVLNPSHADDAVAEGAGGLLMTCLKTEFMARRPGHPMPDPWDVMNVYLWDDVFAIAVEHDGESYGPVGFPAALLGSCMDRLIESIAARADETVVHEAGECPAVGLRH